jgi:Zn-dependent protease with chaperone function
MTDLLPLEVQLFDGRRALARKATLALANGRAVVTRKSTVDEYEQKDLRVSPRIAGTPRFISLPDGVELLCTDAPFLDALPQRERSEGPVAWLERRLWVAILSVFATAQLVFLAQVRGVPWAAGVVARRMPIEYERRLGRETLARLDEDAFQPTSLEPETQERVQAAFQHLSADLPDHEQLRVVFRDTKIGPNAFAMPGGTIVVTDDLAKKCSTEEVTAVLAHELGHLERRHVVRQILADAGAAAIATAVFGDASSVTVAVVGVPAMLVDLEYSREFESEADVFAFELLAKQGLSPLYFADALACIEKHAPRFPGLGSFLSTHPETRDRKAQAERAAARQGRPLRH